MWDSYLESLSENLQEMHSALAVKDKAAAVTLAGSLEDFNSLISQLKSADEERFATFFILHCNKEYDATYEKIKGNDPDGWVEEGERLARFFLNGLSLDDGGSGWGAVLILGRFKELLCRKLERKTVDPEIKHVPASAFVYAMQ